MRKMEFTRREWLQVSALSAIGLVGCATATRIRENDEIGETGSGGKMSDYDVVVIGGGPAGSAAALMLGRGNRRVLLVDAGVPRNAAAVRINGFVTRDGVTPAEFRRVAREQLTKYAVTFEGRWVREVRGESGNFEVVFDDGVVACRRVILCVGMVDELPDLPGFRELWGAGIFQCPYCHGWELKDEPWGFWASSPEMATHAVLATGWTKDVVVFTDRRFELAPETRASLTQRGIRVETRRLEAFVSNRDGGAPTLAAVELEDGVRVPCKGLMARPPQRQTKLVTGLGLTLDEMGLVAVDMMGKTSRAGIYAAGDLSTMMQSALGAAAAGQRAAAALNHELVMAG